MNEFDFYVNSNEALLALDQEHLELDTILHIHNSDNISAANQIFIKLPKLASSALVNWYSKVDLIGSKAELILLLESSLHIHNADFQAFPAVLLIDCKTKDHTTKELILEHEQNHKANLILTSLYGNQIYISCANLTILDKGKVQWLAINAHAADPIVKFNGNGKENGYFSTKNLDIVKPINELLFDRTIIHNLFKQQGIKKLEVKDSISVDSWQLDNIDLVSGFSFRTDGTDNKLFADKVLISSISCLKGKFYIAAKSYINFKIDDGGRLKGIDLVLDMSASTNKDKQVTFSYKFQFTKVTIIGADDVNILLGGYCKKLTLLDCVSASVYNIVAHELEYKLNSTSHLGYLSCNGEISDNVSITGKLELSIGNLITKHLETNGLCSVNIMGPAKIEELLVNLDLDAANPGGHIGIGVSVLRIGNINAKLIEIGLILAKISTLNIEGNVKLGTVLVQTIDNLSTLLWVHFNKHTKLLLDRFYVADNYDLRVRNDGCIEVVRKEKLLTGSDAYVSASYTPDKSSPMATYFYVKAGRGIRFEGDITDVDDIGLFSRYGNIFVKGRMQSKTNLSLIAQKGEVVITNAVLEAKSMTIYGKTDNFIQETIIKAQELVIHSLRSGITIIGSSLNSYNIIMLSRAGDIVIEGTEINSKALEATANNIKIRYAQIISAETFFLAIKDFLLAYSNIHLSQYKYVLFAGNQTEELAQGGIKLATDVTLVGVFSSNKKNPLPMLTWQLVDFAHNVALKPGSAYIEANKGFILGSTISAQDSVIIRTNYSLEIVPLPLYNELMQLGGFTKAAVKEVVSKINAGVIDIDAGQVVNFVEAILRASCGTIKADVINLLESSQAIKTQQTRIQALMAFIGDNPIYTEQIDVSRYFDFTQSTSIIQRISNLGVYHNYVSKELSYTKLDGDIYLDRSLDANKYDKIIINAQNGKILIISSNLQHIYQSNGGGNKGRDAAYDSRTTIAGNNVYLIADEVISHAGKFAVSGNLKIITSNGVHLLPVAVHESLFYHVGKKTTVTEYIVRQVISEINAGYLEIKAGGALEAVSALLVATGIKLEVAELNLRAEYDIFERHVHFVGKEKWHGIGGKESVDYNRNHIVQPTVIQAGTLVAEVNGTTTIEAAQILVKEENTLLSSGDVHLLPKYNIHVHEHVAKKTSLFSFNKGKLNFNGTKTVREHFYGEAPVPTIYYTQGSFYGYSNGEIHLLGAKIIGNDIYLAAQGDIKLEAAPYSQESLITISQKGIRAGYKVGAGEISVGADLFKNTSSIEYNKQLYEACEVIAKDKLVIESKAGDVAIISSKLQFKEAVIRARGLYLSTHHEKHSLDQQETQSSIAIKIGMQESLSEIANRAGYLLNKRGSHWLDMLDIVFNAYKLSNDAKLIIDDINKIVSSKSPAELEKNLMQLNTVRFGIWATAKSVSASNSSTAEIAVDNYLTGGNIDIELDNEAVIEGIICNVENFRLKAKSATIKAAWDKVTSSNDVCSAEITIPLSGSIIASSNTGTKESEANFKHYHGNNMIVAKGTLELLIDENAQISGVKFQASKVMIRAKNLILESLQDVLEERMRGLSLSFSADKKTLSFGGKFEIGSKDAAWTNAIGSIIGTQTVNIIVEQTLEIIGGLIANAKVNPDGTLTDQGKADIQAGTIIAKHLHDYDNGKSFGLGMQLGMAVNPETGDMEYSSISMPIKCSFDRSNRDLLPTIGHGDLAINDDAKESEVSLNRDLAAHISATESSKAALDAEIPISDIYKIFERTLVAAKQEQDSPSVVAVAAGDEDSSKLKLDEEKEESDLSNEYITEDLSKNELHSALLAATATELGYNPIELAQNEQAFSHSVETLQLDLTIAYLENYAVKDTGVLASSAARLVTELKDIRNDVIIGSKSFGSYWQDTKNNFNSQTTSWYGAPIDAVGNMLTAVEDKIGYLTSVNIPHLKAAFKATLSYGMEQAIKGGINGAVTLFGQSKVESALESINSAKEWINEKATPGQQKIVEYAGFAAIGKIVSKTIAALKAGKLPYIPEQFFAKMPEGSLFETTDTITQLKPLYKKGAIYFDETIDVIGEAIYNKQKVTDLPKSIQKDFGFLLKTDNYGVVTGLHHMENHHVLIKSHTKFQEFFKAAGISIDDPINTVFLPNAIGKSLYPTNKALHSGMHSSKYYAGALKEVEKILIDGKDQGWSGSEYQKRITRIVLPLKADLNIGKIKLNKAKTLLEKVKQ